MNGSSIISLALNTYAQLPRPLCPLWFTLISQVDETAETASALEALQHYPALGYPVLQVSARTGYGLHELHALLRGKGSVFVGQSGTGKSSLVRALLGLPFTEGARLGYGFFDDMDDDVLSHDVDREVQTEGEAEADAVAGPTVGALSSGRKPQGVHTTSSARLWHLQPSDTSATASFDHTIQKENVTLNDPGYVIDSPGIREMGLWHLSAAQIQSAFLEIDALAARCRFSDCNHESHMEHAGCAVQRGLRSNLVHPSRLAHYHSFLRSTN